MFDKWQKMNLINMSVLSLSVLGMANVFAEDAMEMEEAAIQQNSLIPAEVSAGKNDGEGIAIAADKMTPDNYRMAVGHAWESSTEQGVKLINTAIGLGANDSYSYMHKQDQRIASLEQQLSSKMEKLDRLATQMEALTRRVAYIQANEVIASASIEE